MVLFSYVLFSSLTLLSSTQVTPATPHPLHFVAAFASSSMPRYAFIVKALSPRDGGWVRLDGYWQTEDLKNPCSYVLGLMIL